MRGEQFVDVLTKDILVGEVVEVRPGKRIPLDGEVLDGAGSVDEAYASHQVHTKPYF